MNRESNGSDGDGTIDRRSVLKATGAAVVGGTVTTGVASAHDVTSDGGPVFCGCSQVCACVRWDAEVIVATEDGDGGFTCERVDVNGDFCYEVDDGKIIALDVHGDGDTYCNPNLNCAGDALADCGINCDQPGEQGGPCGQPPCEHPGRGRGPNNGRGNGRGNGR